MTAQTLHGTFQNLPQPSKRRAVVPQCDIEGLLRWAFGEHRAHDVAWCEDVAARAAAGDASARVLAADLPRALRGVASAGGMLATVGQLGTLVDGGAPELVDDLELDIPMAARRVYELVMELDADTAAVVVRHASRGSRPVLMEDADLAPRWIEDREAPVELDARRRKSLCWIMPDPERFSPAEVVAARGAWSVWWRALHWLEAVAIEAVPGWRRRPFGVPARPWVHQGA